MKEPFAMGFDRNFEYSDTKDGVKKNPLGTLLLAFIRVDWFALEEEAKAFQAQHDKGASDHSAQLSAEGDRFYFRAAQYFQELQDRFADGHPMLYRMMKEWMPEQLAAAADPGMESTFLFALKILCFYPNEPMSPKTIARFQSMGSNALPEWPILAAVRRCLQELQQLLHKLGRFSRDLQDCIFFALDDSGQNSNLPISARRYLMEKNGTSPYERCSRQYSKIQVGRALCDKAARDAMLWRTPSEELQTVLNETDLSFRILYRCDDLRGLIFLAFEEMCANQMPLKRQEGRYVLSLEGSVKGGRTARNAPTPAKKRIRVSDKELSDTYRRLNNAYQMRCARAPEKYSREAYHAWQTQAREVLNRFTAGELSAQEAIAAIRPGK